MTKPIFLILSLFLWIAPSGFAKVQTPQQYLMDEAEELRLAATAGPGTITSDATYYVLRGSGYARAREGSNGFHCFVERSWSGPSPDNSRAFDPRIKAPHCINREGSKTTMKEMFLVAEMAMGGRSEKEIEREVDRAYGDGRLTLPKELSLTYMMSKHQWLGEGIGSWHPHVMLWIPYLTEDQVGNITSMATPNAHLVGKPGSRRSVLVFPVPQFIE